MRQQQGKDQTPIRNQNNIPQYTIQMYITYSYRFRKREIMYIHIEIHVIIIISLHTYIYIYHQYQPSKNTNFPPTSRPFQSISPLATTWKGWITHPKALEGNTSGMLGGTVSQKKVCFFFFPEKTCPLYKKNWKIDSQIGLFMKGSCYV